MDPDRTRCCCCCCRLWRRNRSVDSPSFDRKSMTRMPSSIKLNDASRSQSDLGSVRLIKIH